jgi:hypothetical protein
MNDHAADAMSAGTEAFRASRERSEIRNRSSSRKARRTGLLAANMVQGRRRVLGLDLNCSESPHARDDGLSLEHALAACWAFPDFIQATIF